MLQEYFGDKIEQSARTFGIAADIHKENATFRTDLLDVDPSFVEMFQFEVLAGSLEDTLANIANIALSEKTARRHFGHQDPIGKIFDYTRTSPKNGAGISRNGLLTGHR